MENHPQLQQVAGISGHLPWGENVLHVSICDKTVEESGLHGRSRQRSAGRRSRHLNANDILRRSLVSAGLPAFLEPAGLSATDGKDLTARTSMHSIAVDSLFGSDHF